MEYVKAQTMAYMMEVGETLPMVSAKAQTMAKATEAESPPAVSGKAQTQAHQKSMVSGKAQTKA